MGRSRPGCCRGSWSHSTLSAEELAAIDALDTGVLGGPDQDAIDFRTFKRIIPDA